MLMRGVDRLPHPVSRTWHQVGIGAQREPWVVVTEVLRQSPDVHTVEQQDRREVVPQGDCRRPAAAVKGGKILCPLRPP